VRFERWGYQIRGVWADPAKLESRSGVYVIWCKHGAVWSVLDVGESHDVKESVLNHVHVKAGAATAAARFTTPPSIPPTSRSLSGRGSNRTSDSR